MRCSPAALTMKGSPRSPITTRERKEADEKPAPSGRPDRTGRIEIDAVEKRAKKIAAGKLRTDGKWIAGFYFNNALFRTAAVQHRLLKTITNKSDAVPKLRKAAKSLFPQWTSDKLDMVHDQVNGLKHDARGTHDARTVAYQDALAAVGELLALIEAWTAANAPSTPKSSTTKTP